MIAGGLIRLKLGSLPSGSVCQAQSSLVAEGGSAVRVGGPRTRAGKKGAESEAEVLVPGQLLAVRRIEGFL